MRTSGLPDLTNSLSRDNDRLSALIDAEARRASLFVPPRDPRFDSPSRTNDFPGRALLDDPRISSATGIERLRPIDELASALATVAAEGRPIHVDFGTAAADADFSLQPFLSWSAELAFAAWVADLLPEGSLRNAYATVARLRMVKSPLEIDAMRRTAAITMAGITHAAGFIRDGVDERTLEGELEAEFKRRGAQRLPFASIIKSGPNSLWPWRVLASHYDRRNRVMRDGELVIFDVGAELDYFVSDVGQHVSGVGAVHRCAAAHSRDGDQCGRRDHRRHPPRESRLRELQAHRRGRNPGCSTAATCRPGLFFGHHLGLNSGDPSLPEAPSSRRA